jgi:hypothetical protein
MVCYVVPLAAAIMHYGMRKKISSLKADMRQLWLNLLFLGGAVFGVVDHWWNNELFLVGEKTTADLLLGIAITTAIVIVWLGIVIADKAKTSEEQKSLKSNCI